jgi:soluble lytic murein transglycosylase
MDNLWLTGRSAPSSCNFVFKEWKKSGHMSSDIVFDRIELAVYRRNIRLAKSLAVYLPAKERHWLYEIEKAYYQPEKVVKSYLNQSDEYNKYEFIVIKHALLRLTRSDAEMAADIYSQIKSSTNLCSYDCNKIEHNITYHLVNKRHNNVLDAFKKMDLHNADSIHRAIFMSMLKDEWQSALSYIDKLDKEEQLSEKWLYWRARTLYKLGNHREAVSIYRSLAELRNYYGFIAADHIDYPYNLESRTIELSESDYQLILSIPGIQRARAFIDIGRLAQARREWMYAVKSFTDDQLYIAANLANKWLWHDRAIYTIANTSYTDDLDIRFPMPFKNLISVHSEENDIDPAWVYALIRQESIFMHDARSGSGALGLMQLMPATARQSASRMKKRVRGRYEILQPQNNISLGTYYLKRVYKRFNNHMILATAAYNAGPTNVKRWLPESETDWDIWVETIPFNETRNYVQNVASFRVVYSNKLGIQQFRLNRDLKSIPSKQK